jgi:hypothetical protein
VLQAEWLTPSQRSVTAIETRHEEDLRVSRKIIWIAASAMIALAAVAGSGQDRYTLQLPGGLVFSDFKGYGDWQLISSAETDDRMKVILGNPTIIAAFKAGIPGNGKPFPEGSRIAKLQWKPKKSAEAEFPVNVPDTLADLFFMEKDSKRFPKTGGWGYAQFDYDPTSATFSADKAGTPNCGQVCHVSVKAKDYVFHPYELR